MSIPTNILPIENLEIYSALYTIETSLRELIIESFETLDGPRWYKKRLGADIQKKYEDGLNYEKTIPWIELVPHHPIYYIDFPKLKEIMEKRDNWREVFQSNWIDRTHDDVMTCSESPSFFSKKKLKALSQERRRGRDEHVLTQHTCTCSLSLSLSHTHTHTHTPHHTHP